MDLVDDFDEIFKNNKASKDDNKVLEEFFWDVRNLYQKYGETLVDNYFTNLLKQSNNLERSFYGNIDLDNEDKLNWSKQNI